MAQIFSGLKVHSEPGSECTLAQTRASWHPTPQREGGCCPPVIAGRRRRAVQAVRPPASRRPRGANCAMSLKAAPGPGRSGRNAGAPRPRGESLLVEGGRRPAIDQPAVRPDARAGRHLAPGLVTIACLSAPPLRPPGSTRRTSGFELLHRWGRHSWPFSQCSPCHRGRPREQRLRRGCVSCWRRGSRPPPPFARDRCRLFLKLISMLMMISILMIR